MSTVIATDLTKLASPRHFISNNIKTKLLTTTDTNTLVDKDISSKIEIGNDSEKKPRVVINRDRYSEAKNFPLGWFAALKALDTPAKIAGEGMNIVMPYVQEYDNSIISTFLDSAQAAGVEVLLELRRSAIQTGDRAAVVEFVRRFKHHPAVFGWYLYDEPEVTKISPQILKQLYQTIKHEDSSRPVTMSFALEGRLRNIRQYREAADILMFNIYPGRVGVPEFGGFQKTRFYRYLNKRAARYASTREGFWPVLQGYGENSQGIPQFKRRLPTMAEERYMFYTSVLAGADGLFFWAHYRAQQSWIDSVLTPIVKEFADYTTTVKTQPLVDKVTANRSIIQTALYKNPVSNRYLLIAINHGAKKIETSFTVERSVYTKSVEVITEERYIRLSDKSDNRTFKDVFNPYEVHIYSMR